MVGRTKSTLFISTFEPNLRVFKSGTTMSVSDRRNRVTLQHFMMVLSHHILKKPPYV